ncbi:hypothetical protein BKK79_00955 [Cupriavidus sp. USMAA2-4]|uniref:hypothetical protein n=1 Tax=Cupriavidus sp. USMAA2-4 TaxID=876364 RepID=UPI0008A6BDA2|nr:hypothetical protein [Cupriavidus sp. USMAA2-4]AOY90554.1 hypothetical protein BKK79_00955 [Cupriavidus sp. USMAA2-4]
MAAVPTCAVAVRLYDQNAQAVAGATVTAQLDRYEIHDGIVVPQTFEAVTNEFGECTLDLWPNSLGSQSSNYKIKVQPTDAKGYSTIAIVPDAPTANLNEIAQLPEIPGKTDFQEYFEQAQGIADDLVNSANAAKVAAQDAQAEAESGADGSADSASASASSAAAALASAASAQQSANDAAASLQNTTTQAGAAAASATAAAGSASAASTCAGQAAASATAASSSQGSASASATAAAGSATTASGSAATATTKAGDAAASAAAAATSAATASTQAGTATTKAGEASASAMAAAGSAADAASAKTAAEAARDLAQQYSNAVAPTVAKPGDGAYTSTRVVNTVLIYDTPLTATRTVTLNTTNPAAGDTVRLTRTAAASGAYNVALGALKNLTPGQWAHATYDGAAWVLTGYGSL